MTSRGRRPPVASIIDHAVERLLATRTEFGDRFTDTDQEWGANRKHGPMASMQGLRAVMGALAALIDDGSSRVVQLIGPHWPSLIDEWREVLVAWKSDRPLIAPYDYEGALDRILHEGKDRGKAAPYVDSTSWALSTAVLMNYALGLQERLLPAEVDGRLRQETHAAIVATLRTLVSLQCEDGGWSWSLAAGRNGNLYYTWSAIEGLADYYDYVAGEGEKDLGIPADLALLRRLEEAEPGLGDRVDEARRKATDFLARRFLEKSIRQGLDWDDVSDGERLRPLDASNAFPLVYFDLYLLEALILGGFDVPGGRTSASNREQLNRLYRVLPGRYDRTREQLRGPAFSDPKRAAELSTMQLVLTGTEKVRASLPTHFVRDPGIWPQFLRTMVLYRFYTNPSADAEPLILSDEDSALEQLLEDRAAESDESQREGLWDQLGFNLALTARAIEGLIDAYDYERRLAQTPQTKQSTSSDLAETLADALLPHIAKKLTAMAPKAELKEPRPDEEGARNLDKYLLKEEFAKKLLVLLGDAIHAVPDDCVLRKDEAITSLLGTTNARELEENNPSAYKLLGAIVWLNVSVTSRLLERILEEAVLGVLSNDREKRERLAEGYSEWRKEKLTIGDRIGLALKRLTEVELKAAESKRPPPNYAEILSSLVQASSGKSRKE